MAENTYQIPIDAIPLNVVVYRYIDHDFVIVDVNQQVLKTEQLERASLINQKLLDVFPNVKTFGLYAILEQVYQTGQTEVLDKGLYQDNRVEGWRKNTVIKLPNGDVMAIYEDLTAIKQLEQEKDQRQQQLQEAQQIARLGSWTWDMITDDIEWSDEVFRLFGEAPQSFSPTFDRFLSYLDEKDRSALTETIQQSIKNKTPYQFEHTIHHPKTHQLVYLLEAGQVQYDENGQPVKMFGTVQDTTLYKQNLEQLHSLGMIIDNSFSEVFIFDAETYHFTYLNQAALNNIGYSLAEIQQMKPYDIKPLFSRQQFIDQLLAPLTTGKEQVITHETIHRRKDGSEYDVRVRVQLMNLSGRSAFVVMANDITESKKKDQQTQQAKERYQALFDLSPVGILLIDPATQKAFEYNYTAHDQLGYSQQEFANLTIADYEAIELPEEIGGKIAQFNIGEKISFSTQHKTKLGEIRDVMVFVQLVDLGECLALFCVFQDITEIKRNERALETLSLRFKLAAKVASLGVWEWDLNTNELIWDDNMHQLYELESTKTIHAYQQWKKLLSSDELDQMEKQIQRALETGNQLHSQFTVKTAKGTIKHLQVMADFIKDETGQPIKMVGVNWDVTQQKQYEQLLKDYAYIDPLTGVANRRQFDEVLEKEWRRAERNQTSLSLMMIDIDFFKIYNDLCGHQAGDDCLQQVAKAIEVSAARAGELTARYGGEEFVVLLPNSDAENAITVAESIRQAVGSLKLSHPNSSVSEYVTISVGLTTADFIGNASVSATQLLKQADDALYDAKKAGRNQVCQL